MGGGGNSGGQIDGAGGAGGAQSAALPLFTRALLAVLGGGAAGDVEGGGGGSAAALAGPGARAARAARVQAASATLARRTLYVHVSALAYTLLVASVLYEMPAEARLRAGGLEGTPEAVAAAGAWRSAAAARLAFAACGWVGVALASSGAVESYAGEVG